MTERINYQLGLKILLAALLVSAIFFFALADKRHELELVTMSMSLFGGLALFLYGLDRMSRSFRATSSRKVRKRLEKLTDSRAKGLLTGTGVTALIQSSSATVVMLVGLVSAGVLTFGHSLGVLLGANIGTTITGQLVAFKITKYALLLVAAGFFVMFASKSTGGRQIGRIIFGLGLIFFGMSIMNSAMAPLRTYEPFLNILGSFSAPLIGMAAGALFTALVQSSSATIGIVVVLASQGVLTLESGIALALGANIGTCVTAWLAAIGKPREGIRVAAAHIVFNVLGVLLMLPFIKYLADFAVVISPQSETGISGIEKLASEVPRQVANAHTVFNVAMAVVFLPFLKYFKRMVEKIIPDKRVVTLADKVRPEHLPSETPGIALAALEGEIDKMGRYVLEMYKQSPEVLEVDTYDILEELEKRDRDVNRLHLEFLGVKHKLTMQEVSEDFSKRLDEFLEYAHFLERIGDVIKVDIIRHGRGRLDRGLIVSKETADRIKKFHALILEHFEDALAILQGDEGRAELAQKIIDSKTRTNALVDDFREYLLKDRISADRPGREELYRIEIGMFEAYQEIYFLIRNMVKTLARHTE